MKKTLLLLIGVFIISMQAVRAQWGELIAGEPNAPITCGIQYGTDYIMVGGPFTAISGVPYQHIVRIEVATGTKIIAGSLPAAPESFFYDQYGRLNAVGNFFVSGTYYGAMVYNPSPTPGWIPNLDFMFGAPSGSQKIRSAVTIGSSVFISGDLKSIKTASAATATSVNGFAQLQGSWFPVITSISCSWLPGNKGNITRLAVGPDDLLRIMGEFDNLTYNSGPSSYSVGTVGFAVYDGNHITARSIPTHSSATAYAFFQGADQVTGTFINPVSGLLKWDGSNMVPSAGGIPIFGRDIVIVCNRLFLGGEQFHTSGAQGNLSSTNGNTWMDESSGLFAKESEIITDLIPFNNKIIAIGTFQKCDGNVADYIAIKEICPNASLPIYLEWFKAKKVNQTVQLSWKASMDEESNQFIVERSSDGRSFKSVDMVYGNKNQALYLFTDNNPGAGIIQYRLKYDVGQNQKYSKILAVSMGSSSAPRIIPRTGSLQIANVDGLVQILNLSGQLFFKQRISGSETIQLPRGVYILSLLTREGTYTKKFLIE